MDGFMRLGDGLEGAERGRRHHFDRRRHSPGVRDEEGVILKVDRFDRQEQIDVNLGEDKDPSAL